MKAFLAIFLILLSFKTGYGQEAFWSISSQGLESPIPPECDGKFNEELGRFIIPEPEELYSMGNAFLFKKGKEQLNAGYCFISAALAGHLNAQYTLAQLYNKGFVLPKNDLAAYRWAFIAGLQGHTGAERLAISLEQYLTTQDIELATAGAQELLTSILKRSNQTTESIDDEIARKKNYLDNLLSEIDEELKISPQSSIPGKNTSVLKPLDKIFTKEDRMTP